MKKLFTLLAAVALTAMFAQVSAQGTGDAPQIGSTHQYWVNAIENGGIGNATEAGALTSYRWWISTTEGNLLTAVESSSDFTVTLNGATYNIETSYADNSKANGIEIKWNPTSANKTYYLVVEEIFEGCKNLKAVAIQPVNAFEVTFAAIAADGVTAVDNPSHCAPDIAITASGTSITYNYGTGNYIYQISSAGLYDAWSFNYDFNIIGGDATVSILYSDNGTDYDVLSSGSGSVSSVTPDSNGQATVYFKVTLENATAEEGLDAQTMSLKLTNISDGANPPAHVYTSDGATEFTGDDVQTHTVKARPATTGISFN